VARDTPLTLALLLTSTRMPPRKLPTFLY